MCRRPVRRYRWESRRVSTLVDAECDGVPGMSKHETPLTRGYWRKLDDGIMYEEFPVVSARAGLQSRRAIDGVVVLGRAPRIASCDENKDLSLDGEDVVVIQTKATRLNPYVLGQALLSVDLIKLRWTPRSIRSVLVCLEDDPELRPFIDLFHDVEVHVADQSEIAGQSELQHFGLQRLSGAVAHVAEKREALTVVSGQLSSALQIDGVLVPSPIRAGVTCLADLVRGREVISVHSEKKSGQLRILNMPLSGEVIVAQAILSRMGAALATSVVVCRRGDLAIEEALRHHAAFELMVIGSD